jgi:PTH1 family peptidyl-tRNA hydrolase
VDHVLSKFKPGERATVEEAVANAAQATLVWIRQGVEAAMNRFNGGEDPQSEKAKAKKEKKEKKPPESKEEAPPKA